MKRLLIFFKDTDICVYKCINGMYITLYTTHVYIHMYTYICVYAKLIVTHISELSKRSSYMLRQAFMVRKRRRAWNVDTAVGKTQERQQWQVKGWSVFVSVCINAQSDKPSEWLKRSLQENQAKAGGWLRKQSVVLFRSSSSISPLLVPLFLVFARHHTYIGICTHYRQYNSTFTKIRCSNSQLCLCVFVFILSIAKLSSRRVLFSG